MSERRSSGRCATVKLRLSTREPLEEPMAAGRMASVELLQKSAENVFLRAVAEAVLQILMEAYPGGLIGGRPA